MKINIVWPRSSQFWKWSECIIMVGLPESLTSSSLYSLPSWSGSILSSSTTVSPCPWQIYLHIPLFLYLLSALSRSCRTVIIKFRLTQLLEPGPNRDIIFNALYVQMNKKICCSYVLWRLRPASALLLSFVITVSATDRLIVPVSVPEPETTGSLSCHNPTNFRKRANKHGTRTIFRVSSYQVHGPDSI